METQRHLGAATSRCSYGQLLGFVMVAIAPWAAQAQNDTWTGGAGATNNYWDLSTNWSAGLPGTASAVIIGSAYETIFRATSGAVTIASLDDAGGLTVSGGTLTTTGNSSISALIVSGGALSSAAATTVGTLSISTGTVGGSGTTTVTGTSTLTGGVIGSAASGITNFNGALEISDIGTKYFGAGIVNTPNTVTWSGNTAANNNYVYVGYGATTTINNTGSWLDENGFSTSLGNYNVASVFNNSGTYTKSGAGTTTISTTFDNTGAVTVSAGTLDLVTGGSSTGSFAQAPGATLQFGGGTETLTGVTLTGTGTVLVSAGQVNQSGTTTEAGLLNLTGGALAVNGTWTTATYSQSGGTLGGSGTTTVTGPSTLTGGIIGSAASGITDFNGTLAISGTATKYFGAGTVNTPNTVTWSGNTAANNNIVYFGYGAATTINNTGTWLDENSFSTILGNYNVASLFDNSGVYTKSGANTTTVSMTFDNTGTVNVNAGTLDLVTGGSSTGPFAEATGTTLQFGGATETLTGVKFTGTGTVLVSAGQVNQSGTTTEAGLLNLTGGALAVNGTWTAATYSQSGGTLGGSGTTKVTGASTLTGGIIGSAASGITDFNSTLAISGTATKYFGAGTVNTPKTVTWSGSTAANNNIVYFGYGAATTINNTGTWLDENTFSTILGNYNVASVFNNSGSYTKSGAGTTTVSTTFNNTGKVTVNAGTLDLVTGGSSTGPFAEGTGTTLQFGGATETLTGVKFTGTGTVLVSAGQVNQSGTTAEAGLLNLTGGALAVNGTWTTATYSQSGGTLGGSGATTVTGASTLTGGFIGSAASGITDFNGTLAISGTATKYFGAGTVNTPNTVTWSGDTAANNNIVYFGYGAATTINNTGTWLDENTFSTILGNYNVASVFNNSGTYTKSGAGTTTVSTTFNNTGEVTVNAGTLDLVTGGSSTGPFAEATGTTLQFGGGTETLTGVTLTGKGTVLVSAGQVNQSGTTAEAGLLNLTGGALAVNGTWTAATYSQSGGTLGGSGTIKVTGASTLTGGFIGSAASGITDFNSTLAISGTGTKYFGAGTVNTPKTVTWSGNTAINNNVVYVGYGAATTINNTGTWLDENSFSTVLGNYNVVSVFNNSGTYTKSGAGTTTISTAFDNTGTLNVNAGTVVFTDLANFSGTTLSGGTYKVTGPLEFAGADIVTNAANITLAGNASEILNSSNNSDALAAFASNASTGSFSLTGGRDFTTAGSFTNNGTLSVGNGSVFATSASLTNFSGTTLTGGIYKITGTLEFPGANIVTNAANVTLSGSSSQILNSTSATSGLTAFAANAAAGSFTLASARSFTTAGNFTNAGTLMVDSGSTFTVGSPGVFTQSAGKITDDGTLVASGGVALNAGTLTGTGAITGDLQLTGTLTPGTSATTTGTFTEAGAYTQKTKGKLNIYVGGTTAGSTYDVLNVTTASLAGTLNITPVAGFVPTVGSTFKILNFNSETGTFATVNGLTINSTEAYTVSYQPTDVLLTVVSTAAASVGSAPASAASPSRVVAANIGGERSAEIRGDSHVSARLTAALWAFNSTYAMGAGNRVGTVNPAVMSRLREAHGVSALDFIKNGKH